MAKTKADVEQHENTKTAPQLEQEPEVPVKQARPPSTALALKMMVPPPGSSPSITAALDPGIVRRALLTGSLQRSVGNARISRIYAGNVQTKLKVGAPNDQYEQEADRVAEAVMRAPEPAMAKRITPGDTTIQRVCASCSEEYKTAENEKRTVKPANFCLKCRTGEEGGIQTKQLPLPIQRQKRLEDQEDEALIQTKTAGDVNPEVTSEVSAGIQSQQGGGQPLTESERSFFEPRFGIDFSKVRVHNDTQAASLTQSVNARAFTTGRDIYFGQGQYQPESSEGQRLLAHELTHYVQQVGSQPLNQSLQRITQDSESIEQVNARAYKVGKITASGANHQAHPPITSTNADLQKGPPQSERGQFVQNQAREDLRYANNDVVAALRATGDQIKINTAEAISEGIITVGIISRHPEPENHTTTRPLHGTYFFPDTDLNRVIEARIGTSGAAHVPGSLSNKIYILVRFHFSEPRRPPNSFFRTLVHEAQHYLDQHVTESPPRGTDREVFDLWLNYKTEFNAYWVDGSFEDYPETPAGRTPQGFQMLRWEAIRERLMTTRPYSGRFRWLWTSTPPPQPSGSGEALSIAQWRSRIYPRHHSWFRQQIESYQQPEAFNRLNSPRIELFLRALRSRRIGRVRTAVENLDAADIAEIRQSPRFQHLIQTRLSGRFRQEIGNRLGLNASP